MGVSTAPCTITISPGTDVQTTAASAGSGAVICLNAGTYMQTQTISPQSNQVIRSTNSSSPATILYTVAGGNAIAITQPNATIKDLSVGGTSANRPQYAILAYNTTGTRIYNVAVSYALIGIGINNNASDTEVRNSSVSYAGDGVGCVGCAQPSIWTNNSNNVRIVNNTILNNGAGTNGGGDGEVDCFNSLNFLLQDTHMTNSMTPYIVSCDQALLLHNTITGSREWGLDIVDTGFSSGSDYGLYDSNTISASRNGGGVLLNSKYNTFTRNAFSNNRLGPSPSGSCDGLNVRGSSFTGLHYYPDTIVNSADANNNEPACND